MAFWKTKERKKIVGKQGEDLIRKKLQKAKRQEGAVRQITKAKAKLQLGERVKAIDAFNQLRHQFADVNKCYRELVQNAIDANTDKVEFRFSRQYALPVDQLEQYVDFFVDDLASNGKFPQDVLGKYATELESGLKLVLSEDGECSVLQDLMGEGYAQRRKEVDYILDGWKRADFHKMVSEKWGLPLQQKKRLLVNRLGVPNNLDELFSKAEERLEFYDRLIDLYVGVHLRGISSDNTSVDKEEISALIDQRYAFIQRSLIKTEDAEQEFFQHAAAESIDQYTQRVFEAWHDNGREIGKKEKEFLPRLAKLPTKPSAFSHFLQQLDQSLKIEVRDYGHGMSHYEREEFLKKIFSSSKTNDLDQIGRFGVGFISIFALDYKEIIVESTRSGESWRYHFFPPTKDQIPGRLHVSPNDLTVDKGTKITIKLNEKNKSEIDTIVTEAREHIKHDCKHVEKPIYFCGEEINEGFDVTSPIKVHFGKKGVEGVIGLVPKHLGSYRLENNRIRLEEGKILKKQKENGKENEHEALTKNYGAGLEILISSKYINYNIKREGVKRDVNFDHLVRLINGQMDALAGEVFEAIGELLVTGEAYKKVKQSQAEKGGPTIWWNFAFEYIVDKKQEVKKRFTRQKGLLKKLGAGLPEQVLDSYIIETIDGDYWTMRELLGYLQTQRKCEINVAQEKNELTEILQNKGSQVFKRPAAYYHKELLGKLGSYKDLSEHFKSSAKSSGKLQQKEEEFAKSFAQRLAKSPLERYFTSVNLGHLGEKEEPFRHAFSAGDSFYFEQKQEQSLAPYHPFLDFFRGSTTYLEGTYGNCLVLNLDHPYIQEVIETENLYRDGFAQNLLLQTICQREGGPSRKLTKMLFQEERKRLGKADYDNYQLSEIPAQTEIIEAEQNAAEQTEYMEQEE